MQLRSRALAVVAVCVLSMTLFVGVTTAVAVPARPTARATATAAAQPDVRLLHHARAAIRFARRHGMTSGVAVLDTSTGQLTTAGAAQRAFTSASVVKTLIATRLLLSGQMSGAVRREARLMIAESDNTAASALYPKAGGDNLLPWLAHHYGVRHFGTRPTNPGYWGTTRITALGMVRFYAAVRADHRVWPWLSRAMHAHTARSSAGEPNDFGVAAAEPSAAVKNGWVTFGSHAIINSTGFVNHDRYAVAILSEGPGSLYYSGGERIVTHEADLLIRRGGLLTDGYPALRDGRVLPAAP